MIGGAFIGLGSAALMGGGQSETRLLIKFDDAGLVADALVDNRTCPQGGVLLTGGNPDTDLDLHSNDCIDRAGGDVAPGSAQELARIQQAWGPLVPDEHVEHVFANTIWYGDVASSYARAQRLLNQESPSGNLIASDKSLVFSSGPIPDPGTERVGPPLVRIGYGEIASVEVGHLLMNRWVVVRTNDGKTYYFSVLSFGGPGEVDRIQTQAAGDLIRSKVRILGH